MGETRHLYELANTKSMIKKYTQQTLAIILEKVKLFKSYVGRYQFDYYFNKKNKQRTLLKPLYEFKILEEIKKNLAFSYNIFVCYYPR